MQAKEYFNKPNTTVRILKIIGNIVFYVVILAIILFGIIGVVGRFKGTGGGFGFAGYNAYVVASNSMYAVHPDNFRKEDIEALGDTQFARGELVIVRNLKPSDELKDLDIVTFPQDNVIIIHRIVGIYTDGSGRTFYVTQGDANNNTDGDRTREEFKGIMVANWGPKAGTFVTFIQSGWGIAAIALALGIAIAAWLVYDAIKDKEKVLEPEDLPEEEKSEA
ncbi:MAG: hypothetical protein II896_04535 [Clostridia bacterium]|nr:hypothetical protein [Clostridia bacterium]